MCFYLCLDHVFFFFLLLDVR
uniref:Uncharacterized protein n=1 Tax=Rhizophora mucronata TaxID=61149 RepID=A0A2P2NE29_RHIMU